MKELCWVWKKTTKQQWCSYFQIAHKYWHSFMTDPLTSIVYIFHNGILSEVLCGYEVQRSMLVFLSESLPSKKPISLSSVLFTTSEMRPHVTFHVKPSMTFFTLVWFLPGVYSVMFLQFVRIPERLCTHRALMFGGRWGSRPLCGIFVWLVRPNWK